VAELGVYMLIGLGRNPRGMASGLAERKMGEPQGMALKGKTVGLLGLGGIGQALARRLRPFGVRLIGIKRRDQEVARRELELEWVGGPGDLPELLRRADFVVLCLPLTEETRGIMDRQAFSCVRRGTFLVNLSRGGLVDRDALEEALASEQIAGAGLDVFWEEPPDPDDPIFGYNVLATPHIAACTDVAMRGIVAGVAENIRRLAASQEPLHLMIP
jgi:phosphoglycerate dehydrogenase-like enzyme